MEKGLPYATIKIPGISEGLLDSTFHSLYLKKSSSQNLETQINYLQLGLTLLLNSPKT